MSEVVTSALKKSQKTKASDRIYFRLVTIGFLLNIHVCCAKLGLIISLEIGDKISNVRSP